MTNIEEEALNTFQKNLAFLQERSPNTFELINNLNIGISSGAINENFILEYKNNEYFDILSVKENEYIYNTNSTKLSEQIAEHQNLNTSSNIFRTTLSSPQRLGEIYDYLKDIFEYIQQNTNDNKQFKLIPKFFFLGTLLGLHIPDIIEKLSIKKCMIYEFNPEIFRLSLFVTKYYEISEFTEIQFSILEDTIDFQPLFTTFFNNGFNLNYGIKFHCFPIYEDLLKNIISIIGANQAYKLSFINRLKCYSNTFMKIHDNEKVINLYKADQLFKNKKVLILGAGPSLQAKIEWLKENHENFIIIAVVQTLPLLFKHNLKPDIVTSVHYTNESLVNYDSFDAKKLNDIIFLGASQITKEHLSLYPYSNRFFYLNNLLFKKHLGATSGLSVGNATVYLSKLFNPKEIYLLGIDNAMADSGNTHIESHPQKKYTTMKEVELKEFNNIDDTHLIPVKGNFRETVLTNAYYYRYIEDFNQTLKTFKDIQIFNLSDGAYIENTTPLYPEEVSEITPINKEKFTYELRNNLMEIFESKFSHEDKYLLTQSTFGLHKYKNIDINKVNDIRAIFNEVLLDKSINHSYRDLVSNFLQIIFHYVDGFLNDESFDQSIINMHIKKLNELIYNAFLKLTKEFENLVK